MKELLKVLPENEDLKSLSIQEKQNLIDEFQTSLPGVTMIIEKTIEPSTGIQSRVVDMDISNESLTNKNVKTQPETNLNQFNTVSLPPKEKWCGQSKEQFSELLKLRQDKSIDLTFKNQNWYLSEEHFQIKYPKSSNNDDKDSSNRSKKTD